MKKPAMLRERGEKERGNGRGERDVDSWKVRKGLTRPEVPIEGENLGLSGGKNLNGWWGGEVLKSRKKTY